MKIAFIGPGGVSIPPIDYGAIEILIWDLTQALRKKGHHVDIYNDRNLENVARQIESQNYDFVHLQYDDHITFFAPRWKNRNKWGVTNHYGWVNQKHMWPSHYDRWFDLFVQAPNAICLSPDIAYLFKIRKKTEQKIFVLRNGTNTENFRFYEKSNDRAICVGCVDYRKNQSMLNEYCHNIDFVGPVRDDGRFEFKNGNNYLGVWNKTQLFENLGKYACLILASRGEAAPLVVPEAMACGLSLVLSQQSTANMVDKPWIKIIDIYNDNYLKNYLLADIHNIIIENQKQRFDIKNFAQNTYDWNVIADDYIEIIKNCK